MTFNHCLGSLVNFPRNDEYTYDRKQKRNSSTILNNLKAVFATPIPVLPETDTINLNYWLPRNFLHSAKMNTEMNRLETLKCFMKYGNLSLLNGNLVPGIRKYGTCVQAADLGNNMIMDKANYKNRKLISYFRNNTIEQLADNLSTFIAARNIRPLSFMDAKLTEMKQRSQGGEYLRALDTHSVKKCDTCKISGTEVNAIRGETQRKNILDRGPCRFNGLAYSGNFMKQASRNLLSGSCRTFSSRSYIITQKCPQTSGIWGEISNNANVSIPRFRSTQSYPGITNS